MADLLETIKKLIKETVDANNETGFTYGTVLSSSPLKIKVSDKIILTSEFITSMSHVGALVAQDKVFMLKHSAGEYVILGKVVI